MKKRKPKSKDLPDIYVSDFETTVDEDTRKQQSTEVWSAATAKIFGTDDVYIQTSIESFFEFLYKMPGSTNFLYFHNEKFDGSFILDYLLKNGYTNAFDENGDMQSEYKLNNREVTYSISDRGMWYTIAFRYGRKLYVVKDSLKLLPFSLKAIGKAFDTKHKKLEMEYKGNHKANGKIDEKTELPYIKNDVLLLKEAIEFMFNEGHDKLTIGGCCLEEYKNILKLSGIDWDTLFPNLSDIPIDDSFGETDADSYIRHSYRGGWCYQVKGKEGLHYNGVTADVNSLYPSVMHSDSGNAYPVGNPTFFKGEIPEEAKDNKHYYFVRIRCSFKIKPDHLPWIQIKKGVFYDHTECLETSDFRIYDRKTDTIRYVKYLKKGNEIVEAKPILTLTCKDYELLHDHYDVFDEEILDGCYFNAQVGIFDKYIDKYAHIKKTSKGAKRTLAKLFLNNLYGKLATSPDSSFKVAEIKNDVLKFKTVYANTKKTVYIAAGSAVTSYAKNFTIRAAQKNYYGKDKPGFIYADTDSIHCDIPAEELKGVPVHPVDFNHWKVEASWDVGLFIRQKTYIEHVTHEDLEPIEKPYYNVKCAGLPDRCKKLFVLSLSEQTFKKQGKKWVIEGVEGTFNNEEKAFIEERRTITDFTYGIKIPSKLKPRRVRGGVVLTEDYFTMKDNKIKSYNGYFTKDNGYEQK